MYHETNPHDIANMLRGQQWQITKGHMRAMVSLQGAFPSGSRQANKYDELHRLTEEYIKVVEGEALKE